VNKDVIIYIMCAILISNALRYGTC